MFWWFFVLNICWWYRTKLGHQHVWCFDETNDGAPIYEPMYHPRHHHDTGFSFWQYFHFVPIRICVKIPNQILTWLHWQLILTFNTLNAKSKSILPGYSGSPCFRSILGPHSPSSRLEIKHLKSCIILKRNKTKYFPQLSLYILKTKRNKTWYFLQFSSNTCIF